MKAHAAIPLAEKIRAALLPFCERVEIAGSLRRGREWVNDLDFVCLPKAGQREALKARCKQRAEVIRYGDQNLIVGVSLPSGEAIQVDVFIAREEQRDLLSVKPTNFGTLLLCRTGSKEHNIYLVEHAKRNGLRWMPYDGVFRGDQCLACAEEAEIFSALGMAFVAPALRERA